MWLTGWQRPDHNTLWRFSREHRGQMRQLFKRTVGTAVKVGLVDLALQAVDGTKVAGNAARERSYDGAGLQRLLERTEGTIRELEIENETGNDPPPSHLPEALTKAERLRDEVKEAIKELAAEEAVLVKSRQGIIAGYNAQAVVSPVKGGEGERCGFLITGAEVVADPSDTAHLVSLLEQAQENTGRRAEVSLADAGYTPVGM
jgi:hypothetical protein